MDRPYYYRSAEDVVPRDVVYLIVCGSVKVVPPETFEGYEHLARVVFEEGVQVIGRTAFADCPNLTTVDCRASSLRTIDDQAFDGCERLSEVMLHEGLQRIGKWAFSECALERIAVPSSVVEIGEGAFWGCYQLSEDCESLLEMMLHEGLQRIGASAFNRCYALKRIAVPSSVVEIGVQAFQGCRRLSELILREGLQRIGVVAFEYCALERIAVPSSVVEIDYGAFAACPRLWEVTLAGGMVTVASDAFDCCLQLERITISSVAIVVDAGEDGSGRVVPVTGRIARDPANHSPRLIMASPHLALMRPEELTNLTDAVNQIADTTRGAGPLDLADGDVSARIRECFADRLSTWYRSYKREAAAILELGLWKIELGRAEEGETAGGDAPTRDDCRIHCGANPIVGLVLSFLAGPHRRADQGGNAGSIQP